MVDGKTFEIFKINLPEQKCVALEKCEFDPVKQKTELFILVCKFKEMLTIGRRAGCELIIKDKCISGFHANLRIVGDSVELFDLNSKSGVFVKIKTNMVPILKYKKVCIISENRLFEFESGKACLYAFLDRAVALCKKEVELFKDYVQWGMSLPKENQETAEIKQAEMGSTNVLTISLNKDKKNLSHVSLDSGGRLCFGPIEAPVQLRMFDENL